MEPERPIEKLLRAWAKKRRQDAGPPPEMHPATRRLLQGELARTLGKDTSRKVSFSTWFAAVWPRFAWGLGVFAVLAVTVWLVAPPFGGSRSEDRLAKTDSRGVTKLFSESAPGEAPASRTDQTGNRQELAMAREKEGTLGREISQKPPSPADASSVNTRGGDGDRAGTVMLADANKKLNAPAIQPQMDDSVKEVHEPAGPQPGFGGAGRAAPAAKNPAQVAEARGIVTFSAPNGQTAGPDGSGQNRGASPPAQSSRSLAAAGNSSSSTQRPMAAAGPAASPAPEGRAGGAGSAQYGLRGPTTKSSAPASSLTPVPPASATVVGADLALAKDGFQVTPSTNALAITTLATDSASAPTRNYFYADDFAAGRTSNIQRFARLDVMTKAKAMVTDKASPVKTVLASFEISRVGSEVRVVDADGSVYTGFVQPAADLKRSRTVKAEQPGAVSESLGSSAATVEHSASVRNQAEAQTAPDYFFRVVGTNRTLGENVTFTGQFVAAAEVSKPATITNSVRLSGGTGLARFQESKAAASEPPANSSRIAGKVLIGNRSEIEINAASAGK